MIDVVNVIDFEEAKYRHYLAKLIQDKYLELDVTPPTMNSLLKGIRFKQTHFKNTGERQ
jgi:hypothetical protein